ncbi:MAG: sigma-E factor negative regulatory protein [Aquitalea sp.]|nr:sigma-E factor negative regulatory protein [Aquitalea sp.]
MKEKLSALMDGELDGQHAQRAINAITDEEELKETWNAYHLIGDAMRANTHVAVSVRQQVAQQLVDEPTVLAPRRWFAPVRNRRAGAVALAASVSFAAVIGWQQLSHGNGAAVMADRGVPVAALQPAQEHDDLYLAAHQEMTADQSVYKVSYGNGVRH